MINENSIEYRKFIDNLTVKKIGRQNYYYYRINNPILNKSKQIYIGKYQENHKPFLEFYLKKVFVESKETFQEILQKDYENEYLTPSLAIFLDILRYSFHFSLKEFSDTDIKKFEEARYTEYVHGTTSIEGNTYTLRETDITLNLGQTVKGKENREFYEIDNYRRWKEYQSENKDFVMNLDGAKKVHQYLLATIDDPYITPGEFREVPAFIRGTEFQPIPAIFVGEELDNLFNWFENSKGKRHPIELIAEFHQRFEMIHPFNDGNGRVGRELMRLQLNDFGFPSIFINKSNRADYLFSLDSSIDGDYSDITSFIATLVIKETINSLEKYSDFMNGLLEVDGYAHLRKILSKDKKVNELFQLIIHDLSGEIAYKVANLLDLIENSNEVYVETKLIRKLERIIEDPFLNLKINLTS